MTYFSTLGRGLLAACVGVLAAVPDAGADPVVVMRGVAQLPTSGLVIDLPSKAGVKYHVSGSWAASADGATFDTRDIIDEIDVGTGNVVVGTWVMSGYFDKGACASTTAEMPLTDAWTQSAKLWGESWTVRGGVYSFDNSLGKRPGVALCRDLASGHALLLYHFLTDKPTTTSQADVMAAVGASGVLAQASKSYTSERTSDILPLHRTEVKNRGEGQAVRNVKLPVTGLSLDLPDDGYYWMVREGEGVDLLDRLLPTLPEISAELAVVDDFNCVDVFSQLTTGLLPNFKPSGLPSGWVAGPGLNLEDDGYKELTSCYETEDAAVMLGIMMRVTETDVSSLQPLMHAIEAAVD